MIQDWGWLVRLNMVGRLLLGRRLPLCLSAHAAKARQPGSLPCWLSCFWTLQEVQTAWRSLICMSFFLYFCCFPFFCPSFYFFFLFCSIFFYFFSFFLIFFNFFFLFFLILFFFLSFFSFLCIPFSAPFYFLYMYICIPNASMYMTRKKSSHSTAEHNTTKDSKVLEKSSNMQQNVLD